MENNCERDSYDKSATWEEYCGQINPDMLICHVADRYISVRVLCDGYESAIYDEKFKLLEKEIFNPPTVSLQNALELVIESLTDPEYEKNIRGHITSNDKPEFLEYQEFLMNARESGQEQVL